MANFLFSCYRSTRPDLIRTLCSVRSAGHYRVGPGFRDTPMRKDFLELFWCAQGRGYFKLQDRVAILSPGEIFCHFPGDWHEISSGDSSWDYWWLTVDGPEVPELIRIFGLRREAVRVGECPRELFNELFRALAEMDADGAHLASVRCYEILSCAANRITEGSDDMIECFKKLVEEHFSDPGFTIGAAAAELGVHRSTLHRVFTERCGLSPQEYLCACRLQQAVNRLRNGEAVKVTAEQCGFSGQNYFTKVFRRCFGQPPGEFRKSLLLRPEGEKTTAAKVLDPHCRT